MNNSLPHCAGCGHQMAYEPPSPGVPSRLLCRNGCVNHHDRSYRDRIDLGKRGDEFWCYALGMLAASVCSSHPPDRVALELNKRINIAFGKPTVRWRLSKDATFAGGEPNPAPCPDSPDHQHYLLT